MKTFLACAALSALTLGAAQADTSCARPAKAITRMCKADAKMVARMASNAPTLIPEGTVNEHDSPAPGGYMDNDDVRR